MRVALLLVIATGCRQLLGFETPVPAGDAGPQLCTSNVDCTQDSAPICKLPEAICVQCVENTDCAGTMPVCDVTANSCQACAEHADCPSEVCLPTGACADADDVAYIAEKGVGNCSQASPCEDLMVAIATTKIVFKVTGFIGVTGLQNLSRSVTVFADPGAVLAKTGVGSIVQVANGVDVTIYDLDIAAAVDGDGITMAGANTKLTLERVFLRDHDGHGLFAVTSGAGATLTIRRSIIVQNSGGGVDARGVKIDMTNNLFVRNGAAGVNSGGLVLDPLPGSRFEFNTVADNTSLAAATSGVSCINSFAGGFNNIVINNALGAQCAFDFSLLDGQSPTPQGANNVTGDVAFESIDSTDPRSTMFYRIRTNSAAKDAASPNATLDVDIDGEARPSGNVRDIGADEFVP